MNTNSNKQKTCILSLFMMLSLLGCNNYENVDYNESNNSISEKILVPAIPDEPEITIKEKDTLSNYSENYISAKDLLDAINRERSGIHICGKYGVFGPIHPLVWDNNLHSAALEHVKDLSESNTFSHDGSGTISDITGKKIGRSSKFYERIVYNGYSNYYIVGENIAGGQRTLEEVMDEWMASPGHCANIMGADYTEVGFAVLKKESSTYRIYWSQNFGSQRKTNVSINKELFF